MSKFRQIALIAVLLSSCVIFAQTKLQKESKSVKADSDVTIDLDTNFTNIEIETWDKNEVVVDAIIEGKKVSKQELQELLEDWDVEIEGSGDYISIQSGAFGRHNFNFDFSFIDDEVSEALRHLQFNMADMPDMPEMPNFQIDIPEIPEIPNMNIQIPDLPEMKFDFPEMPKLPELPELPEGVHNVNFDVEKYKKEGESYLNEWVSKYEKKHGKKLANEMKKWAREFAKADWDGYSKKMEAWGEEFGENFGKDYEKKMEKWSKEYEKKFGPEWEAKWEEWGKVYEKKFGPEWEAKIEKWAEDYEKSFGPEWEAKWEAWGEKFAESFDEDKMKELEERAEELSEKAEKKAAEIEAKMERLENEDVKRTIKIKMPKDAKLKMNVRHGELKFASVVHDLKATLSHTTLLAASIDGGNTSINASYSPIFVENWNAGELNLNVVDEASLKNVKGLMLGSNSSNINIDYLAGNATIDGSFGDLTIHNIQNTFNNLNIILENSDAYIKLPKIAHNLQFKGSRSRLKHPKKSEDHQGTSFTTGSLSDDKTIVINAKYSTVVMQ
jgi:hypothetical protein